MKNKQVKILKTDQQRKAFMHPFRSEIIGLIIKTPMTITQVARQLDVHPANLTHHFKKLENANIIKLHEERDIGRVIERYFTTTAASFEIYQEVFGANSKVLSFLKNDLSKNIVKLKGDDSEEIIGLIKRSKINSKSFQQFSKRLRDLIEEFSDASEEDGETYALNLSLYPHSLNYGPLKQIQIRKKGKK